MNEKEEVSFEKDELGKVVFYNMNAFRKPIKTAIFLGGMEFEHYSKLERYQLPAEEAWRRIRGLEKLKPGALSAVQKLATWRETRAREKDLPRNWILKDDVIIDIARLAPVRKTDLENIRGMQGKTIERYGKMLLNLVEQAQQEPPVPLPKRSRGVKASVQEDALAHSQMR
jgi:ribonuclease D